MLYYVKVHCVLDRFSELERLTFMSEEDEMVACVVIVCSIRGSFLPLNMSESASCCWLDVRL